METATPYGGGRGGKIRRLPRRQVATSTPYDRPSSAVRAARAEVTENAGNGWISKLAGPATRLISGGASLFGSVLGLRRPNEEIEQEFSGGSGLLVQEDEEVAIDKPSHESQEAKRISESFATADNNTSNISEFEHLLKQKTITRAEFEHLIEVLRSRTIDLESKPSASNEVSDTLPISNRANVREEPTKTTANNAVSNTLPISPHADVREEPTTNKDFSMQPYDPTILANQVASPEELAKAYMSSRVKVSPSLSIKNQVFLEKKTKPIYHNPEPVTPSIFSKSVVRISGSAENPESGYLTPKLTGKSALHKFSRSHFFEAPGSSAGKDGKISQGEYPGTSYFQTPRSTFSTSIRRDGKFSNVEYTGSASYFETPKSTISSGARQVLKRRSSVLDSEPASFGPMRRLRQKHLGSPLTNVSVGDLSHGSSSKVIQEANDYSTTTQMPGQLQEKTQEQTVGKRENMVYRNSAASVPPKSAETAKKIFQHLDKLASSPKEKLSNLLVSDDSSSKNKNVHVNNLAVNGHSPVIGMRKIVYEKQAMAKENDSSTSTALGIKLSSGSSGTHTDAHPARDGLPATNSDAPSSDSIVSQQKKPAFETSQAKDSPVVKKDNNILKDSFSPTDASRKEVQVELAHKKAVGSESTRSHILPYSSGPLKLTSALTNDSVDMVSENGAGFNLPSTPAPITYSAAPQIHTTSSKNDDSSFITGKITSPSFSFGGKGSNSLVFSSPTIATSFNTPAMAENGAMQKRQTATPSFSFGAKDRHQIVFLLPTLNGGSGVTPSSENGSSQLPMLPNSGGKELDRGCQAENPQSLSSSEPTLAPTFFGSSHNERTKNGSLGLSSTVSTGIFCSTQTSISQSSSNAMSSSIAPVSSNRPSFQFGHNKGLEEKAGQVSPFSLNGSMPDTPFSKTGNNALSGLAKASEVSNISPLSTASTFTASPSTILSSQSTRSISTVTSAGTNIFTFGSSAQSSNSNSSVAVNSLKESGSLFGNTTQYDWDGGVGFSTKISTSISNPGISNYPFRSSTPIFGFGASPIQNSFSTSSISTSSSSSPSMFGPSTASQFSGTAASASVLSSPLQQPHLGAATATIGQISASPGNEEIKQTPPSMPTMHAIPAAQSGATPIFQFGSQQNYLAQDTGASESPIGENFSMGSGGVDKASRRIFKAKRKK